MRKLQKYIGLILLIFLASLNAKVYTIQNQGILRKIEVDKSISTIQLKNKYTGQSYAVESPEFKIMLDDTLATFSGPVLTAKDFAVFGNIEFNKSQQLLRIPLKNSKYGIKVVATYQADGDFYMHKWLEFESLDTLRNISTVEVERMHIKGAKISRPSQEFKGNKKSDGPVYADNFFLGLEFPKQVNSPENGFVRLKHFPGKFLEPGQKYTSKKAVIGASPDKPLKRNKDYFFKYIDEWRNTEVRNFKVYNTWFLLVFDQQQDSLLKAIETHVRPLYEREIVLDGFVVDDGWQDRNTMWELNEEFIPDGLGPDSKLQQALKKYESNLHLWMPLSGQYGLAERGNEEEFYRKHGWETGTNWSLCLAPGNKIYQDKKERMIELVKKGVTSFKADFAYIGCDKEGHNHLPNMRYGTEATVEGMIDIINSIREIDPDLFYYLTTEINHNPWWLNTNDILWESFGGDIKNYTGNDEPTKAQIRMSGRDEYHWQHCLNWFIPQSSYMTHGIISSSNPESGLYCTLQEHIDNAILYYARGVMWSEIYVTEMNKEYWDALADVIHWSDSNWDILTQQPKMSGGPSGHKPYYWSHFKKDTGIVIVRNPTNVVRGIDIPLNEKAGMPEIRGRDYLAQINRVSSFSKVKEEIIGFYQPGEKISLTLQPWQVKVLEISPVDKPEEGLKINTADIDLGKVKIGQIRQFDIAVEAPKNFNYRITDNRDWIKLEPKFIFWKKDNYKGDSQILFTINTDTLKYSTNYNGVVSIKSEYHEKKVSINFTTNVDPNQKVFYLSNYSPLKAEQDWGNLNQDRTVNGNKLTLNGKEYDKGLGTHTNSKIVYNISDFNGKYFKATVGMDDETNGTGQFEVYLDKGKGFEEKPVFKSKVLETGDEPVQLKVNLQDAEKIKLIANDGGDNINGDHADWAKARIIKEDK